MANCRLSFPSFNVKLPHPHGHNCMISKNKPGLFSKDFVNKKITFYNVFPRTIRMKTLLVRHKAKENGGEDDNEQPWYVDLRDDLGEPSPDNLVVWGLSVVCVVGLAIISWQLLFVTLKVTLAAIKYTFVAAALIGIIVFFL